MRYLFALLLLISISPASSQQQIIVPITARVDTTDVEKKAVYHLYGNYLNSRPDSIYRNPYWNADENEEALNLKSLPDLAARNLFYDGMKINTFIRYWQPKILGIDKVAPGRYLVKTIFMSMCEDEKFSMHTPVAITRLYAVKDGSGTYKLENAASYDTRIWKTREKDFITYRIHPYLEFNEERADKAIGFCRSVARQFHLKELPHITYFVMPDADEMWKLFSFDFYLYGVTGLADMKSKKLYVGQGVEDFYHELVHQIMPVPDNPARLSHNLITEGVATWLGGPAYDTTYAEALAQVSEQFRKRRPNGLEEIVTFKYRNEHDSNLFYVTGAVICEMAYKQGGLAAFWQLYNCPNDWKMLQQKLSSVLGADYECKVIGYISGF